MSIIPRGYEISLTFTGKKENNKQTIEYAIVGMNVAMFDTPFLTEGMNEHGLMISLLFFPHFTQYNSKPSAEYDVNLGLLLPFILEKCKTIEEAVILLEKINPVDEPETQMELPCHYLISDKTGEAVVVEPLEGGLKVYRNEMGVLTNAPTYEWHKINLRNYLGISNLSKEPQVINGYKIEELGEGTEYLGLPGDYTPVSRFVRLAFSKNYMPDLKTKLMQLVKCLIFLKLLMDRRGVSIRHQLDLLTMRKHSVHQ